MSEKADYETHRTVTVVNEQADAVRVKIRTLHDPIFSKLWSIASKVLEGYHTDVIHDALILSKAQAGDKFLWGYRKTGTTMISLQRTKKAYTTAMIAAMANPLESWHLIEVVKVPDSGHSSGYVTWLAAKDVGHLHLVVEENFRRWG